MIYDVEFIINEYYDGTYHQEPKIKFNSLLDFIKWVLRSDLPEGYFALTFEKRDEVQSKNNRRK